MHCISDSTCYTTLHCPLHLHLHMCCLHLFVCLSVSPSRLFLLIDGCQSTTLRIELCAFLMHLQSSSTYSDTLHIRLHMLCNSTLPPASVPLHVPPLLACLFVCLPLSPVHMLLACLFVSPSGLFPLIDGQWTSAKSDCTHSIRRGLGRRLRSSLLLNSSPSTSRDHPLFT